MERIPCSKSWSTFYSIVGDHGGGALVGSVDLGEPGPARYPQPARAELSQLGPPPAWLGSAGKSVISSVLF